MGNPSAPENWDTAYEGDPEIGDSVGQGDDWIRQVKLDVRERAEVEHHFASINGDDNGLHRVGSARAFVTTNVTAPTGLEVVDHDNTGGGGTLTLSANATNSSPAETVGLGRMWMAADQSLKAYGASGFVDARSLPHGHIGGFGVAVTGGGDDVLISVGEARTGTSTNRSTRNAIRTSALTKQIDATWALGTNAGGMATGAVAANTWYHLFLIVSPTGVVDAGFSTNIEATTLLANATVQAAGFTSGNTTYRRIASLRTNGSSKITDFSQHGDEFYWLANTATDEFLNTATATDSNATLTFVPPGVKTVAHMTVRTFGATTDSLVIGPGGGSFSASGQTNATPLTLMSGTSEYDTVMDMLTDTNSRIKYRVTDGTNDVFIQVLGYRDARGRWD